MPPKVAINYYKKVVAKTGAKAVKESMRFFMVPGMGHGPGTTGDENFNFDALGVIEQWKQTGKAPDTLIVRTTRTAWKSASASCASIRRSRCIKAAGTPKIRRVTHANRAQVGRVGQVGRVRQDKVRLRPYRAEDMEIRGEV